MVKWSFITTANQHSWSWKIRLIARRIHKASDARYAKWHLPPKSHLKGTRTRPNIMEMCIFRSSMRPASLVYAPSCSQRVRWFRLLILSSWWPECHRVCKIWCTTLRLLMYCQRRRPLKKSMPSLSRRMPALTVFSVILENEGMTRVIPLIL